MTRRSAAALAALLAIALAGCGSSTEPEPYGLVWADEFDGPAGQLPDASRWKFDVGTDWGNAQLEYDTDRALNVSLDGDGHLAITARKETYLNREYTSGRIKTKGLFERTHGRFEARIRLPVGQGIWPAFWMLGNDIDEVHWPTCGEIDIMEYRGQEPSVIHGSIHGPGYSGGTAISGRYVLPEGAFNDDFHVFAIEWNPGSITWFVDDRPFQTIDSEDIPAGTRWVFDHPFFILLNVAVGGHWVGAPDASTVFPQVMLVDWVRVYGTGS